MTAETSGQDLQSLWKQGEETAPDSAWKNAQEIPAVENYPAPGYLMREIRETRGCKGDLGGCLAELDEHPRASKPAVKSPSSQLPGRRDEGKELLNILAACNAHTRIFSKRDGFLQRFGEINDVDGERRVSRRNCSRAGFSG